jgi:hypothetical protein
MAAGFPADANLGAPAGAAASPGFLRFPNGFIAFIGQVRMTWSRLDDVLRQVAPALVPLHRGFDWLNLHSK